MCMCANLEGQDHDESMSAPADVWRGDAGKIVLWGRRRLATAQHLCGTLVGFINPSLVGISLESRRRRERRFLVLSVHRCMRNLNTSYLPVLCKKKKSVSME